MHSKKVFNNERLSLEQKNANSQAWYKDKIDEYDVQSGYQRNSGQGHLSEYKRKKVNYDLFNNILNLADFEYVCEPFGAEAGELPAQMVNRDICSARVKALLGLEMKRPFTWKVVATNKEATTRREAEEFNRIKQYVISEIMSPISQEIELKYQEQTKGKKLTPDEQRNIQEQIQNEIKTQTPAETKRYMQREHQDPAEVLANQLLEYVIQEQQVKRKFNSGWKHGLISAEEIYWVGILNGKPRMKVINPLRFSYDKNPDMEFIEDGDWATYEYRMTPAMIISEFGKSLKDTEIDKIYENSNKYGTDIQSEDFFTGDERDSEATNNTNRVVHTVFKSLRKIGFLKYLDENEEIQEKIVNETYRFNKQNGDISIDWEWIPELYEGYKIDEDIYVDMQPIPGQFKDLNNLYYCPLPYKGGVYDDTNSQPTALMDRIKMYQYLYNIVIYRIETLMASDKGKKVLMNINAIPKSAGIDIKKWQYYFESTPFGWFDPSEEGNNYSDVNAMAKVLDLSLASDIGKYIEIAEFLDQKCGKSVGITDATLGDISSSQEVGNTKQAIVQTSHIIEPYFEMHNNIKRNVIQALVEVTKVAFSEKPNDILNYVLDDMSLQTIKVDTGLLDSSTFGIFASDGAADAEVKENLRVFAHAALQNQKAELSDVIAIIRQKDSQQAEEILRAAEMERNEREDKMAKDERQHETQMAEQIRAESEKEHARQLELIIVKEEERRKTEVQKQAILSMGFSEDKDVDQDGVPDVLELAKHGVDADIKRRKQDLDERKFEQSKKEHEDKQKIEKKKLNKPNSK